MNGTELIAAERERQVTDEHWSPGHDDGHDHHELALAAACYAAPDEVYVGHIWEGGAKLKSAWPWEREADKRHPDVRTWYPETLATALTNRGRLRRLRIRELVKAGALIAAEIDRLQRLESSSDALSRTEKT
jgi:hypothetical protein